MGEICEFFRTQGKIKNESAKGAFERSTDLMQNLIFGLDKQTLIPIVMEIGAIPEDIRHDSSEEKLYAKVSDIVLAKCFQEFGLKSSVNKERANCADVMAKSQYHGYSLVGDAKSFRLSRTAKNAKDFKVASIGGWKGDSDYAVLVCPYFQYPKSRSQIYGQALNDNVALFSWEYLSVLLENNVVETHNANIANLWNLSFLLSGNINVLDKNNSFLDRQDELLRTYLKLDQENFSGYFSRYKASIITRGEDEIKYWEVKANEIKLYSRERAIKELLESLKLSEKIVTIKKYIDSLREEQGE